jgi:catalase
MRRGVFFIRDAIKFPELIHALKPDPITCRQDPARAAMSAALLVWARRKGWW